MTVSPLVPQVSIGVAAASARLPDEATKSCVFVACSDDGVEYVPEVHASGDRAQASFGRGRLSQMLFTHAALDPNRTPVMLVKVPSTIPGVLHLDTSGVAGDVTVSPDSVVTPNNYYQPYFEVLVGGTVGIDSNIRIRRSADYGRHVQDVTLGLAAALEISGTGIKIGFAAVEDALVDLTNAIATHAAAHFINIASSVHGGADATSDDGFGASATNTATAITRLALIKAGIALHVIKTSGSVHGAADTTAQGQLAALVNPTTDIEAVTFANALKAILNAHEARTTSSIHGAADATNPVTEDDALPITLSTGDIITGWTEPPRADPGADYPALFEALKATQRPFSMICFGEWVAPNDVSAITSGLTTIAQPGSAKDVQAIFSARPRFKPIPVYSVAVTFGDANPDTLARASGSWIADGVQVGMRLSVGGSSNNDDTFVRIATVTALTLTFTQGVAFVAEGPVTVDVLFEETEADYYANITTDWSVVNDTRLTATAAEVRVDVPTAPLWTLDKPFPEELASKFITSGPDIEAGQIARAGAVGGALAVRLNARIYQGDTRIHHDAAVDDSLAAARMTVLRRAPDGRIGAFVNTGLTLAGTNDAIDTVVKARLANEWKRIARSALTDEILSGLFADQSDLNRLSEGACQDIESRVIPALQRAFRGRISNLDSPPPDAIFTVDRQSDLSTGVIACYGKIVTKFYPRGFNVTLTVTEPGQV